MHPKWLTTSYKNIFFGGVKFKQYYQYKLQVFADLLDSMFLFIEHSICAPGRKKISITI